jgi:hypothetical protein
MKKIVSLISVAALAAIVSLSAAAPSSAAPWHRGYGPGIGFAAGVVGFMAGAAAASAAAHNSYYGHRFVGAGGVWRAHEAACYDSYKSYDARSDTYLGYDGYRHYCEL